MERVVDLQCNGLKLVQDDETFCCGCDSVELSNFVSGKAGEYAFDLGCGNGVIAVLLAGKFGLKVTAVEIQARPAELARRNVRLNRLDELIEVIEAPMQRLGEFKRTGCADIVVCNPPYRRLGGGIIQQSPAVAAARHEILVSLSEVAAAAAYLLPDKGRFYLIQQTERLAETLRITSEARLEPKKLQILRPALHKPPHLFMVMCVKGGRAGLNVLPERDVRIYG